MANMHAISQEVARQRERGKAGCRGEGVSRPCSGGHENMLRFCKTGCHAKTNRSGNKSVDAPPCPSPPLLMTHILLNECHIAWNGMEWEMEWEMPRGTFTCGPMCCRTYARLPFSLLLLLLFFFLDFAAAGCCCCQAKRLLSKSRFNATLDAIRLPEILRLSYEQPTTFVNTRSCINAA